MDGSLSAELELNCQLSLEFRTLVELLGFGFKTKVLFVCLLLLTTSGEHPLLSCCIVVP